MSRLKKMNHTSLKQFTDSIFDFFYKSVIIIYFVAMSIFVIFVISNFLVFSVPDSETASSYATTICTAVLVVITYFYAKDSNNMVKLNSNAQEILYIQMRLEKLYYPLNNTLNRYQIDKKTSMTDDFISMFKSDLFQIMPYIYLSSDALYNDLDNFINIFIKNRVSITQEINEEIEKKKENKRLSEEEAGNLEMKAALLNALPAGALEKPVTSEIGQAINLYPEILRIIENDISHYRQTLKKLTTSSKNDD